MIGSLRGTLLERTDNEALIEVQGVGYRVTMHSRGLAALPPGGEELFVYVHHHLREDGQTLYGFATRDERTCFEALLGTHGVGPALALAILGVHTPEELRRAVATEDLASLCLVPGVGRKTAQRLVLELQSRLGAPVATPQPARNGDATSSALSEVRAALAGLGYGPDEIREALRDLPDGTDPSALLRDALQTLAGAR